ncbi:hypothetical protein [Candidatus Darwinibacter acetoxidans]
MWEIKQGDALSVLKTIAGESYRLELLDETRRPLACFDFDSWGDAIDFAQVCLANGHKVVLGKE